MKIVIDTTKSGLDRCVAYDDDENRLTGLLCYSLQIESDFGFFSSKRWNTQEDMRGNRRNDLKVGKLEKDSIDKLKGVISNRIYKGENK